MDVVGGKGEQQADRARSGAPRRPQVHAQHRPRLLAWHANLDQIASSSMFRLNILSNEQFSR